MKKFMIGALVAATLIGAVALTSGTYATLTATDSVTNNLSTGSIDIEVNENEFVDKEIWNGSKADKLVQITNNSKSPALIRVAIIPRWVDENDNPWPGDTSIVDIEFNNDSIIDSNTIPTVPTNKWVKSNDSEYYYYAEIVPSPSPDPEKPGEMIYHPTEAIIKSIKVEVPPELENRYEGKKLIVDVKSEAVLAAPKDSTADTKEAVYKSTWTDITDKNITDMLDELSKIN